MTIIFKDLDFPNEICRIELNNSKCIDTARLFYAEELFPIYGIVLWEHPKYYRRGIIRERGQYGHTVIARSETVNALTDRALKPLLNEIRKALRNGEFELDITDRKTELDLSDLNDV